MYRTEKDALVASQTSNTPVPFMFYISSTNQWAKGACAKGKRVGVFEIISSNGTVISKHSFNSSGLLNGDVFMYYPSGNIRSQITYKSGREIIGSLKLFTAGGKEVVR